MHTNKLKILVNFSVVDKRIMTFFCFMKVQDQGRVEEYYNALLKRDPQYIGIFYVGVLTTDIFCISTCRARKPKRTNVVFYTSFKDALTAGFRPCKVCKPTEQVHETPAEVEKAIALVEGKKKVTDYQLREQGLQPEMIRRWFKKNYGITFHTFQRMARINTAFHELKNGQNSTSTAFSSGYESLSGFSYTYKKMMKTPPSGSIDKEVILLHRFSTPLGPMFAGATDEGLCLLEFTDRRMLETEFQDLQKRLNAEILVGENHITKEAERQVIQYFKGQREEFNLPLVTPGTQFQQSVWELLQTIPFGKTATYGEQAQKLGNIKAIRAVATANGMNRIAIVIPCHRVIGKDGSLVGYAGGLERKRWLLELERGRRQGELQF